MRARTSRNQANGATPFSLAVSINEAAIAHRSAPPSLPVNSAFLSPRATGLIARSTGLVSKSMRPSFRKRVSAVHRLSAYQMASAKRLQPWRRPS